MPVSINQFNMEVRLLKVIYCISETQYVTNIV